MLVGRIRLSKRLFKTPDLPDHHIDFELRKWENQKLDKNQDEIAKEKSEVETIPISDAVRERPSFIFDQLSIHKDAIGKITLFFKRAIQVTFYLAL